MSAFSRARVTSDAVGLLKCLALWGAMVFFSAVTKATEPIVLALAAATLPLGGKWWTIPVGTALSCLPYFSLYPFLAHVGGACVIALLAVLPFSRACRAVYRLPAVTLLACLPYLLLVQEGTFLYRFAVLGGCAVFSLICHAGLRAVAIKGFSAKRSVDESLGLAVVTLVLGLGVCHLLGANAWKAAATACVLLFAAVEEKGVTMTAAVALSLPLVVVSQSLTFAGVFPVFAALAVGLNPVSPALAASVIPVADALIGYFLGAYGSYGYVDFLYTFCAALAVGVIPHKLLFHLSQRIVTLRERQLARATVNRNRALLSGKLYEISSVFSEMQALFFGMCAPDQIPAFPSGGALDEICRTCPRAAVCHRVDGDDAEKLIRIGVSKGRLSLVDLSADVTEACKQPNHLLFGLNRMLSSSREKLLEKRSEDAGKELVATQAGAIADIIKRLAADVGRSLRYNAAVEKKVARRLAEKGIAVSEIMAFGQGDEMQLSVVCAPPVDAKKLTAVLSKTCGVSLCLDDKIDLTPEKCYLLFGKKPRYDAAFGVAMATKHGSEASGDTHSLVRIDKNRFLVALCDGMGSGTDANTLSASSLSLIESFYRAGMDRDAVFATVNRIFTLGAEDRFTAIDAATVDLQTGEADLIKMGAPYGFVLTDGGIRLVEGSSLPLGILDDLKPGAASATLRAGDTLVLLSDGVTDAFASSTDLLDFLAALPAKNPQSLADAVLEKTLALCGGKANDDATVVAVRLFSASNSAA